MRAIIGIGNPGARYKNNRHNIGFQFLDYFAEKRSLVFRPSKFDYEFVEGNVSENGFVLIKPVTFVNLSGSAVLECTEFYRLNIEDIIVIVDDINLPLASLRIRKSGGDGGHNGLSSIIFNLNSDNFARFRVGVGNEFEKGSLADYVLTDFDKEEMKILESVFQDSSVLIEYFVIGGYDMMMREYGKIINDSKKDNPEN